MKLLLTEEEIESNPFYKRGLLEDAREFVLMAIETKFDSVPEDIKDKVKKINDVIKLREIGKIAIKANSIDEVREKISVVF